MVEFDIGSLKFDEKGLIPAIAQDAENGDVLMMAWMNAESLDVTLKTGRVTYWSRSRAALWEKGATSGHTQTLVSLSVDCDRDCLLMQVVQVGSACHTYRRSCFYTDIIDGEEVISSEPQK